MELISLPSVWIVDDDEDDLFIIESAFSEETPPIKTLLISDSTALLARLETCVDLPKLLLLDLNMPRLNGLEVLAQVRSRPQYAPMAVIMLTTSANRQDQQRALALGVNAFITKPVSYASIKKIAQSLRQQWALS